MANKFTDAVFNTRLDGVSKAILYALAYRANNQGECWPSIQTIARDSGFERTAVKNRLEKWQESGLVTVVGAKPAKNGTVNVRRIDYDILCELGRKSPWLEDRVATHPSTGSSDGLLAGVLAAHTGSRDGHRTQQVNTKDELASGTTTGAVGPVVGQPHTDKTDEPANPVTNLRDSVPNPAGRPSRSPDPSGTLRGETHLNGSAALPFGVTPTKAGKFKLPHEHDADCSKGCGLNWSVFETLENAIAEGERRANVRGQSLTGDYGEYEGIWRLGDSEVCKTGGVHVWIDFSHVVQQCSGCDRFRSSPVVYQWTPADELEAEYMELVELYDPYDPDWPKAERPNHCQLGVVSYSG
jgi:DNA-binding Lrp family transcriptional regulator